MNKKSLFSAALWMAGLSALSKVLGLIRESALAAQFGATGVTDAYKIAFSLPNIFFAVIAAAISQTFIPVYADYLKEGDSDKNNRFISNLINWIIICSTGLLILLYTVLPIVIRVIAPGFDHGTLRLTIELASIMLPAAVFFILSNLASAFLQSHNRFIAPVLVWYPHNFFIIGCILFGGRFGIHGVAWGSLFAFVSMLIIQLPSVHSAGFRYQFIVDTHDKGVQQIVNLSGPVMFGVAFNQLYIVIDRMLASGLPEGSITALDYANRVNLLAYNIFILTILTVIYPSLSNCSENIKKFTYLIGKSLRVMMIISLPISVGLIILREPIIQVLFQRGAFDSNDMQMTSYALSGLAIGIGGTAMREVLNRGFYALKDTRTPMINGMIAIVFNVGFCVMLVNHFGIGGLALGTSMAAVLSGAMLLMRLKKKLGAVGGRWITSGFLKTTVATVLFAIVLSLTYDGSFHWWGTGQSKISILLSLAISGGSGLLAYVGVLHLLKMDEVGELISLIKSKANHKSVA